MIVALRGLLEAQGTDWVQVRVGGVSLQIWVPTATLSELGAPGQEVQLHTHLHVREDSLALYGFSTPEALHVFHILLEVSGVGPRLGLNLLSAMSPQALAEAIASGDEDALTQVPGIGKRTASRIVLELKDKLRREGVPVLAASSGSDGDVVAALLALGYSPSEARRAAAVASDARLPLEERVRRALQRMAGAES